MCVNCKPTDKIPYCSMQARLDRAGVETIRPEGKYDATRDVQLRYNGKTIYRPLVESCPHILKNAFGVII